MEYLNVLKTRKKYAGEGTEIARAICIRDQSMEAISCATVHYMIIDDIICRMLRYFVISSLNFT